MFQYELHLLKKGNIVYTHRFIDNDYQVTMTRAEITTREQLRKCLSIFLRLRKHKKTHVDKIVNKIGVFYTVKIFS